MSNPSKWRLRRLFYKLGGVAGVILFAAGAGKGYQSAQPPPASTPTPGETETIHLDLDRPPHPITVARDKTIVVRVRLRAGGMIYNSIGSRGSGGGFGKPLWNLLSLGPLCDIRQKALMAVFSATTVATTRAALEAFHATESSHPCPARYEDSMKSGLAMLSPQVELMPANQPDYEPRDIVIEEFDLQWKPVQTWRFPVLRELIPSKNGTEESWIVRSVVEDIAALAHREVKVTGIKPEGTGYVIEMPGSQPKSLSVSLRVGEFLWDPAVFARTATILGGPRSKTTAPPLRVLPLRVLQTPTDENLHSVERELRAHLARFPLDSRAHEASAFLLGVLGLRYSEGATADVRPVLNRMTAHLALAAASADGRRSTEGSLALVMLDLLTRREQAAAASLTALKAGPLTTPHFAIWERALRMRATKDWRVLTNPEAATLIERLEYFRAVVRTRGKDFAVSLMGPATTEAIPDWSRLLACDQTCASVELGNAIGEEAMKWEVGSATNIGLMLGSRMPSAWWWTETAMNRSHPIPDELWRGLSEKAIAAAFVARYSHLAARNDTERLRRFPALVVATYPNSRVLTLLAPLLRSEEGPVLDPAACKVGVDAANESPWKTTSYEWRGFAQVCQDFPSAGEWFNPWVPRGTLYDYKSRLWTPGLQESAAQADWGALAKLPSYELDVIAWKVGRLEQRDPEKRDFEPFRTEFGYNIQPLRDWRRVETMLGRPKHALEPARLACQLEAEDCFQLIGILRANDLPDEAFQVGVAAFKASGGTVTASHHAYWLVDEYVRRGQGVAARALAQQGAQTGSYMGLYTLARLMEREGRFEHAQEIREQIDATYDDSTEQKFLIRRLARLSPEKREEIQHRLLAIEDEKGDGGIIHDGWLNDRGAVFRRDAEAMGLRQGDRVTAVDGWRITNLSQLRVARSFTDDSKATVAFTRSAPGDTTGQGVPMSATGALDHVSYAPIR